MSENYTIATLCAAETFDLNEAEINHVVDMLHANGGYVQNVQQAHEHTADIIFSHIPKQEAHAMLHEMLRNMPVDYAVQKEWERNKKLLLSDMDSTMIGQECVDELADFAGQKAFVAEITQKAMRGEIAFTDALKERVALLKELPESVCKQTFEERITINAGAHELLKTLKHHGAYCVLVSGGFEHFTELVTQELGFDVHEANKLLVENGKLTGGVAEPILNKIAKVNALEHYAQEHDVKPHEVVAIGDGANDIPMLEVAAHGAGLGVAYKAHPAVQDAMLQAGGMCINHSDLRSVLWAIGLTS